ncbi:AMP-binding protein [Halobacillus rhizosphaerae]|uniref:LuxE/PaaK family acyltransferase n=1 Tax=Halobacillus rhizosphaerae TaxID=3064889 RepID=UPI00398A513A
MSFFSERETWSKDQMEDYQQIGLIETVKRVYNDVPFYRKAFDENHLSPEDIHSLDDIQKLPFTQKKHLRENYPFQLLATPMEEVIRIHASSGTSGKPTVVAYTKNDMVCWGEIVARGIYMAGGRKGDVLHNAYGYGLFTGGLGLHVGSETLGCATVPISGGNTSKQITLIQDFQPKIISTTPSYLLNIGESMRKIGIDPAATSIERAILGAEPWSEEMRKEIEKMFNIKAIDIYGLSEVMGPGIAMECEECQDGLHIAEDHFLVEVINPDTLENVPDGEDGELVFTSLTKEALPIIRYRTGDISSIKRETCVCGRTTTRMNRVKGRIDDMLIVRGVNVFPSEVERYICEIEELTPNYQIHLFKKGALDHVELHVEVCENYFSSLPNNDLKCEMAKTLISTVQQKLKMEALISIEVKLKKPFTLKRSEGKASRIIDKRESFTPTIL